MTTELNKKLKIYQEREAYCNEHQLSPEQAINVIKNGYEGDDLQEIEFLKRRLALLEKRQPTEFFGFVQKLIEEKRLSGKSIRHFEEAQTQVINYFGESTLDINDINYEFLRGFEAFKRKTTKTNGTMIKKTIRTLRTIYNEARRRGKIHNENIDPFDGLDIQISKKDPEENWKVEDLKKLFNFEPKKSTSKASRTNMLRVIDMFFFQIAIGGHDLADIANLKWACIKDQRLKFQRFKLRSQTSRLWTNNMISPFAQSIIDKHGDKHSERIFTYYADPTTEKYRMQNGYHLKTLNRITTTLNIPRIKTKSPRYIFRSLGGKTGVNDLLLMQIMAHKPSSVSHRYQKDLSLEAQDEAHMKILDILFD
ncbi:phage integrase SAM-like domain-containing protein [Maribacter sp. TH_r10]|uniref:phage integrase SAM-like domain-containing protein n=1 Tax=Maribacter sp. TH_r10 TaxID=3082086 RepID=UPI00295598BE|nr:phage integrase SAM-like domain-containing protein [Maribacter sp. TH_r10]MDV7138251.1 phage integrase SAM-like domain-containing protein [Maribacter sp. TH_r10]